MSASTSTLSVVPVGYNGLQINWTAPTGSWSQQILLRSSSGPPSSIYSRDGTVLPIGANVTSYVDTGLSPGRFYYYSLLVYSTSQATPQYVVAGSAQGLVLTDYGFGSKYQAWIPDFYQELDFDNVTVAFPTEGPTVRYLDMLGHETDWLRSEIESLFLFTSAELISGALLPLFGANYGVGYEPELGMAQYRVLVENAVYLYRNRGTANGIESAASAYTGYGCVVTIGPNLEIQLDDSVFDRSVGHWVPGNSDSVIATDSAVGYGYTPQYSYNPIPSPAPTLSGITPFGYLPINNENIARLSSNNPATPQILYLTTCAPTTAITLGIPIQQRATPSIYVVSAYFLAASATSRSFFMQIDWYSITGALISSTTGSAVADNNATWVRAYVVGSPPAGAYYFGRTLKSTTAVVSDVHFMAAEQVEVNTQATPGPSSWSPPRDIRLNLLPVRQNLITNPIGGASSSVGWSAVGGTVVASSSMATPLVVGWPAQTSSGFVLVGAPVVVSLPQSSPNNEVPIADPGGGIPGAVVFGGAASSAESLGSQSLVLSTSVLVNPGISYSFSCYMMAAAVSEWIGLSVLFYNAVGGQLSFPVFQATLEQSVVEGQLVSSLPIVSPLPTSLAAGVPFTVSFQSPGAVALMLQTATAVPARATSIPVQPFIASMTYPAGMIINFSQSYFQDVTGVFTRGSLLNAVAPPTAATALIQITIASAAYGEIHYLGAPLFEPNSSLLPYFDAGSAAPASDFLWEGVANGSVSDYYPNLVTKLSRLISVMPNYIPIGSTFSLVTGAQALTAAGLAG